MHNKPKASSAEERIQDLERRLAEAQETIQSLRSSQGKDPGLQVFDPLYKQMEIEEALRRYELLASHSRDLVLFMNRDDGRILEANAAAEKAYGYSREELLTLSIHDLRAEQTQSSTKSQMALADAGGLLFETIHRRKDGSTFPVEVSSRGATIGGKRTLISIIRDISTRKQAEAALRQSEILYRTIAQSFPLGALWVVDNDLRFLTVEGSLISQLSLSGEELEGRKISEALDENLVVNLEPRFLEALAGQEAGFEMEYAGLYLVTQSAPLYDEIGRVFGAMAITLNMTDRRREEQALRSNEERLRLAYEAAGLGTWDWQPGNTYSINNDIYFKIHGLEPDPEGRVFFGPYLARVHPEDRERLRLIVNRAGAGENVVDLPFRYTRPDGSIIWIQSYRKNIFENGKFVRQIGAVRDITDQVRYEENLRATNDALQFAKKSLQVANSSLRKSEERFRLLVDSMDDFVFTLDTQQRHTALYGYKLPEYGISEALFLGKTPVDILGEEEAEIHIWANNRVLNGENLVYEWTKDTPNGPIHFQTKLSSMRDERGQIIGIVGVSRDITEIKQAEMELEDYARRLEQSNQELQEFAYVASHDLQEPLRKIRFFGEAIDQILDGKLEEQGQDYLKRMNRAVERMQKMITSLLELSRVSTQGLPFTEVDLKIAAQEAVSDLEMVIQRTGGSVLIKELPVIEADPLQMRRLLQNLIGNALKYHPDGVSPVVSVEGAEAASEYTKSMVARIAIEDNGIGFDMENLERVFQPFQRLHGRNQYEGTGMGLAICKKIVERHGGYMTATSKPGVGSRFIVELPLRPRKSVESEK